MAITSNYSTDFKVTESISDFNVPVNPPKTVSDLKSAPLTYNQVDWVVKSFSDLLKSKKEDQFHENIERVQSVLRALPILSLDNLLNALWTLLDDKEIRFNNNVADLLTLHHKYGTETEARQCCIELYQQSLKDGLKNIGITFEQYQSFSRKTAKFEPLQDPFVQELRSDRPSPGLLELQEKIHQEGCINLTHPDLNVVIKNIEKFIESDNIERCQNVDKIYKHISEQCTILLAYGSEIPYTNTVILCIKFIFFQSLNTVLALPESFHRRNAEILAKIEKAPAKLSVQSIDKLINEIQGITFSNLTEKLSSGIDGDSYIVWFFEQFSYMINFSFSFPKISKWAKMNAPFLVWPTFESMEVQDFNRFSNIDIFVAGISMSKLSFHDGFVMTGIGFFEHDFNHACMNYEKLLQKDNLSFLEKTLIKKGLIEVDTNSMAISTAARLDNSDKQRYLLNILDKDDEHWQPIIDILNFNKSHENGFVNILVNYSSQVQSAYSTRRVLSSMSRYLKFYTIEASPKEVVFATLLLNLVTYMQCNADVFPEFFRDTLIK